MLCLSFSARLGAFHILTCRGLVFVLLRMTFRLFRKLFDSAGFFDLLCYVGHTTGSYFCFLSFLSSGQYDRLFLACFTVLLLPNLQIPPASFLLVVRLRYLAWWVVSSQGQRL